jgi:hypothetical protein
MFIGFHRREGNIILTRVAPLPQNPIEGQRYHLVSIIGQLVKRKNNKIGEGFLHMAFTLDVYLYLEPICCKLISFKIK